MGRVRSIAQIIVGALAIVFLVWALVNNWPAVAAALISLSWPLVVVATLLIVLGLYVNMLSWRAIVQSIGKKLTLSQAANVFFVSQLGKYIPGGIWPVVASAKIGQAYGLSPMISVTTMTVALLMSVAVASVFAIGCLFMIPALMQNFWWLPVLLLVAGLIALTPPVLNRLISLGLRVAHRAGSVPPFTHRSFAVAIIWCVLSWLAMGSALSALIVASNPSDISLIFFGISGYALSWVAGFAALLAPAGLGVREGVLVLVLGTAIPAGAILGLAVLHRFIMTAGDIVVLLFTRRARPAALAIASSRPNASADAARVGYVTRKYSPSVGGMETLAVSTTMGLKREFRNVKLMALGRHNSHLLWWVPKTAIQLIARCALRRESIYLFGDAMAWMLLGWIPMMMGVPAFTMVCGLDITFKNRLYQTVTHRALRRAPRVLAISQATLDQAIQAGIEPARGRVLTLGSPPAHAMAIQTQAKTRELLLEKYSLPANAVILLTTGRLVSRKGVLWFVRSVLPQLDDRFVYLIAGTGPDAEQIRSESSATGMERRIRLLGQVSEEERVELLNGADNFVQPNIKVDGDMEGFGLVVVEAAQAGLITVAARLEGLQDAIRDGQTGYLVESGNEAEWIATLTRLGDDPNRATIAAAYQDSARSIYSLENMGKELRQHILYVLAHANAEEIEK